MDLTAGPMLDYGALYSPIGYSDIGTLSSQVASDWTGQLDPLPALFRPFLYRRYGAGDHHSETRSILVSVVLKKYVPDGTQLLMRHLVFYG